jgi:hypothetical protein
LKKFLFCGIIYIEKNERRIYMIQFDNVSVSNMANAIRGMRNPLESWKQSDSRYGLGDCDDEYTASRLFDTCDAWMEYLGYGRSEDIESKVDRDQWIKAEKEIRKWLWDSSLLEMDGPYEDRFYFGPKDLKLAQSLVRAGTDESKFMRQIFISVDITAPLYWWKEMDTYKIGTVANSTSTMHKLSSRPIEINDFSFDKNLQELPYHLDASGDGQGFYWLFEDAIESILEDCEYLRQKYIETNDKRYWRALIQLLPESYNQTRTWTANYAVLRNIYFARRNHKLQEWRDFCKWIETLPWAKELICLEEKKER